MSLMNFYVLLGDVNAPEVRKLPVVREMQVELKAHFDMRWAEFYPQGTELVRYSPGYRPESGELVWVPSFELPPAIASLSPSPASMPMVSEDELESGRLHALVAVRQAPTLGETDFLFQSLDSRCVVRREGITLFASGDLFRKNDKAGVVIRDAIDAYARAGQLFFSSEFVVRRFLDLTPLFVEATTPELRSFIADATFAPVNEQAFLAVADQWVRRKVKLIGSRGVLGRVTPDEIHEAAAKFGIPVTMSGDRLVLPEDKKDLKVLLRFLDDDYLESDLTQAHYVTNSKRPV